MAYGKITNGILVQKQPDKEAGFVAVPDDAVCGQVTADGGLTFTNPPVLLQSAKDTKIAELGAAYLAASYANVVYNTNTFQADEHSQQNLTKALSAMGTTAPSDFYWVDLANAQIPFTKADAQALADLMFQQGWTAFKRLQVAKAAVRAAKTVADVQAVVW